MIALIITIIVLLILAGVILGTLTGQGNIIENAENVVAKYNNSIVKEQQLLNEIEKYFQNYLEEGNIETAEPEILESLDIANNPEEHFGGYVTNYTTPSGDPNVQWRIFYADEDNVYLIASDYIHFDYAPKSANYSLFEWRDSGYRLSFNNVYNDYSGSEDITDPRIIKWLSYVEENENATGPGIQSVAFMLDTSIWNPKYANLDYAEYVIGGPTLELFCASYKKMHSDKYIVYEFDSMGYKVKWNTDESYDYDLNHIGKSDNLYALANSDKCYFTWIASPSPALNNDRLIVIQNDNDDGYLTSVLYNWGNTEGIGFRPLVCLKSETQLEKISDTEYKIVI